MPIRINLLAEAQAAEEIRRRDPVKRAAFVAVCLVVMVLVWISSLQVKIMADKSRLGSLQSKLSSRTNDYFQILNNKKKLGEVNDKLAALNRLAANRFLQATVLNSLLHTSVDGIQITRLRTDQAFDLTPEVKLQMEGGRVITAAKPAIATEKIRLLLDAKDASANPGNEQINKFRETLAHTAYFQGQHISTNNVLLKNLAAPLLDNESGKPYVQFNLECLYPDRVH